MSRIRRGNGLALAAALGVALIAGTADAYPDRPIRLIVSFPPGGSTDSMARLVQPAVEKLLGQPLVIENRAGASGLIAIDAVAKAPPDGYVIGVGGIAALGSNHAFQAKPVYEPRKDIVPVTGLAGSPFMLAAAPSFQGKSLQDVIALVKAKGDKIAIGHGGNGTPMHLTAALFNQMAGINAALVPYRGMAPVVADLIGSHVAFGIIDPPSGTAALEAGRIKVVAVTSAKRFPRLPDVPTFAESGLPRFESNGAFGIVVPAGTPADVIARLHGVFVQVLNDPGIAARIYELGGVPMPMTPDQFATFIRTETEKWLKVAASNP